MSDLKTSDVEKDSSLNIPGILADFFLKKISMPSDSDISDYKHKSKRKKSKHKKRKHKKSRHHHGNSDSDSSSRTSELNPKEVDDDLSSSEEMGIKRLKKIKNLKMHLATSTVLQPSVSSTTDSTVSDKNIVSSTTSENPVFYGPSLELLLSGVNSAIQNSDYVVPVKAPNKEKSSQVVENIENDVSVKSDLKIEHKLSSTDSVPSAQINIDSINNTEVDYAMETDVNKFSNVSSSELDSSNTKTKEIDSENKVKEGASVNDTTKNNENSDDIKKTDISSIDGFKKDIVLKKDSANLNKKTQQDVDSKIKSNDLNVVKSKIKSKRKHSRSRSRSSSPSKHASPKSKSKSRRSRSRSSSHSKHASPKSKSKSRRSRSRSSSHSKHASPKSKSKNRRSHSRSSSHSKHASSKSKSKNRRSRSRSKDSYKSGRKKEVHTRSRSPHNKRNRSVEHRRRRSYSRSQSRSHSRSRYRQRKRFSRSPVERYRKRTRSRSRSYGRYRRSRSRGRRYGRSRERHHTSRSRHGSKSRRSYSRSRSRSKSRQKSLPKEKSRSRSKSKEKHDTSKKSTKIDQAKVLETAKKNVLKMMKDGTLPEGLSVESLKKEQLVTLQTGGKSVQELTDFCVRLSQKENEPDTNDNDENDDKADDETGFVHHPFKVKEPTMIKLNIKNAVQLPIKTPAQKASETVRLSSVFPVSSGNKHKQKELEWVPVVPEDSKANTKSTEKTVAKKQETTTTTVVAVVPQVENVPLPPPPAPPAAIAYPCLPPAEAVKVETPTFVPPVKVPVTVPAVVHPAVSFIPAPVQPVTFEQVPMITYTAPSEQPVCYPETPSPSTSVSVFKTPKRLDIPAIITKRFHALTKLQSNPNDFEAIRTLQEAQQSIQEWVESQQVPGLFTGSTDAKVLSVAELCGPTKYYYRNQKDILTHAPPVTEGKGMSLLKKMGWNPGEGLGKNKEGSLEPLVLDIKTDKKGLVSEGENSKKGVSSFIKELQGKHPVSALMELCSKRKWKPPLYSCVMEHGPPHKKVFCFKVEVNGVEYQPVNPCTNKKIAKADAAVLCLQSLNVLPKTT